MKTTNKQRKTKKQVINEFLKSPCNKYNIARMKRGSKKVKDRFSYENLMDKLNLLDEMADDATEDGDTKAELYEAYNLMCDLIETFCEEVHFLNKLGKYVA
jgi:hypothetical protein